MLIVETFISCDGNCGKNFGVDQRSNNGMEQRYHAKRNGWAYVNGEEYCHECYKKLKEANKELRRLGNNG